MSRGGDGRKKAARILAAYIFFMLADGLLTLIATPDLSREGNPLVARLGLGWGALVAVNLLVLAGYALLIRHSFVRYRPRLVEVEGARRHYYSQLLFHRPDRWLTGVVPKDWGAVWAMTGYACSYSLIVGRIVLVAEWLLDLTAGRRSPYWGFRSRFPFGRVDLWVTLALAFLLLFRWIDLGYRQNRIALQAQRPAGRCG